MPVTGLRIGSPTVSMIPRDEQMRAAGVDVDFEFDRLEQGLELGRAHRRVDPPHRCPVLGLPATRDPSAPRAASVGALVDDQLRIVPLPSCTAPGHFHVAAAQQPTQVEHSRTAPRRTGRRTSPCNCRASAVRRTARRSRDILAKSSTRASLARSAAAVVARRAFCSAFQAVQPITPNSTAKPHDTAMPPAAMTSAWLRHFANATGSIIETSMTSGQMSSGCTDTTAGAGPKSGRAIGPALSGDKLMQGEFLAAMVLPTSSVRSIAFQHRSPVPDAAMSQF